jgi:hypothetical protein
MIDVIDSSPVIIDNFFHENQFFKLKNLLNCQDHPWNILEGQTEENEGDPRLYYGFTYPIVHENEPEKYNDCLSSDLIFALNEKIKYTFGFEKVLRCRLDMTTYRGETPVAFKPHVDYEGEHYTSIFYIQDSNSPTIIYNETSYSRNLDKNIDLTVKQVVEPKKNRLLAFKGNHIHTGMAPIDSYNRILVNTNFV